ncbi:MAG: hypothetical protein JKY48_09780 [Flavobacteriales bacterium]|nr:hypothetical protein [Flavobacteriales bacterium]
MNGTNTFNRNGAYFNGADSVLDISNLNNTKTEIYIRNSGGISRIVTNKNEVSSTKFDIALFVGCNYYFNESISIDIESYALALLGGEDVTTSITNQSTAATTRSGDSSSPSTSQLALNPKTVIAIGYRS